MEENVLESLGSPGFPKFSQEGLNEYARGLVISGGVDPQEPGNYVINFTKLFHFNDIKFITFLSKI
mgnify:CR=1 FL=1